MVGGFVVTRDPDSLRMLAAFSVAVFIVHSLTIISISIGSEFSLLACSLALAVLAIVSGLKAPFLAILTVVPIYVLRAPIMALSSSLSPHEAFPEFWMRASLSIPDLLIIAIFLVSVVDGIFRRTIEGAVLASFCIVVLFFAAHFLMSDAPVQGRLAYIRYFLTPIIVFLAGFAIRGRAEFILSSLVSFISVSLAISIVIHIVLPFEFWAENASNFFDFKYGGVSIYGVPGSWITSIREQYVPRLGGTFLDPIALGYWASMTALVSWLYLKRPVPALLAILSTIATFSKGALLGLATATVVYLWYSRKSFAVRFLAFASSLVIVILAIIFSSEGKGSFWVHQRGLWHGIIAGISNPVGHGLGVGGNWTGILEGASTEGILETGAESGLGIIGYQLGLVGLACVAFFWLWQVVARLRFKEQSRLNAIGIGLTGTSVILVLFQENSLSVTASFLLWWLLGVTTPPNDTTDTSTGTHSGITSSASGMEAKSLPRTTTDSQHV